VLYWKGFELSDFHSHCFVQFWLGVKGDLGFCNHDILILFSLILIYVDISDAEIFH
jgi:hypothetical protein